MGLTVMQSQEGFPVYSDYLLDNYYLVYPSMAGITESGKVRLTARQQWFDVENAPNLQTVSVNSRIGEKVGAGLIIFNDANGYHSQIGFKGTFAYHLNFAEDSRRLNQLSFGLSAGAMSSRVDQTDFVAVNPGDPTLAGLETSQLLPNFDLGLSYNFVDFFLHVAALNLLGEGVSTDPNVVIDNRRRMLVSFGKTFGAYTKIEPSVMYQITQFTDERTIDLNLKFYRNFLNDKATLWGGVSYRRSFDGAQFITPTGEIQEERLSLITPLVGVNFNKLMVAYNYSYQMGDIRFDNGGFHQITIGYDFKNNRFNRFDCYCPAAAGRYSLIAIR